MTSNATTRLLTPEEAAGYLSVSKRTLKRLVAEKELSAIRVRGGMRFRLEDLLAFVEKSHWT